jgi:hypothetical protein
MAKRTFITLVVLMLTLPFIAPERAQAVGHDSLMVYYTGSCPYGLTYNGSRFRECDNTVTDDGTLDGTWKCDDQVDCTGGGQQYMWYEKCNGVWVYRYTVFSVNEWPIPANCYCT